jgi:hypothetical protein
MIKTKVKTETETTDPFLLGKLNAVRCLKMAEADVSPYTRAALHSLAVRLWNGVQIRGDELERAVYGYYSMRD